MNQRVLDKKIVTYRFHLRFSSETGGIWLLCQKMNSIRLSGKAIVNDFSFKMERGIGKSSKALCQLDIALRASL
jgi:hypothetical protein